MHLGIFKTSHLKHVPTLNSSFASKQSQTESAENDTGVEQLVSEEGREEGESNR